MAYNINKKGHIEPDISNVPAILRRDNYWQVCIDLAKNSRSQNQRYGSIIVKDEHIIGKGWNRLLGQKEQFPFRTSFFLHAERAAMGNAILEHREEILEGAIIYVAGFFCKEKKPFISRICNSNSCISCTKLYLNFGLWGAFPKKGGWSIISPNQAYENAVKNKKFREIKNITIRDYRLHVSL